MAEVIRMPRLSDTMAEGVIVSWNKKVGDSIKPGDVLAEVETDKATMELESYQTGVLLHIGVDAGKAVKVDGVLAVIGKAGEDYTSALSSPTVATVEPATPDPVSTSPIKPEKLSLPAGAKEIRMPLLSDTMTEGKIISWQKKVGETVKSDDVLAEVETDKATMEVVGYEAGTLLFVGVEAGKAAKVNEIIAIVGKAGTDITAYLAAEKSGANAAENTAKPFTAVEPIVNKEVPVANTTEQNGRVKASPLARKMAAEKGIAITALHGSGDGGRVIRKDVENYQPGINANKDLPTQASSQASATEGYTDIPLTQMRKTIARRLGESMFTAPHFYLTMELNMDNAMAARTVMNEMSPVKISFNDMLIKACAAALRLHPDVNSSWLTDQSGNEFIRRNHHIHIGSAVAMPEGLIVPVIRNADQKSLSQIAADAKELYQKARDKKLQPAEFSGNTFTISNLGMMDIESFTAIINPPDSCILAVGTIKETVVKKGDGFAVTHVMKVTLSCDHRSVDGAVGAAFLQTVKKFIEQPVNMLV